MDAEVGMTALSFAPGIVMEGTPEDGPVPIVFHPNRGSQDLFGGRENIFLRFSATSFAMHSYEAYPPRKRARTARATPSQWYGWLAATATRTRNAARVLMIILLVWNG
jgi:hypothetical protein